MTQRMEVVRHLCCQKDNEKCGKEQSFEEEVDKGPY